MNSLWCILVYVIFFIWIANVHGQGRVFDVTRFGAIPNGKTDSKQAFASAWAKACQTLGGVVLVPAAKTFLLSGGDFNGPCKGKTTFRNDGTLVASADPKLDANEYWIVFDSVQRLKVVGKGVFNGNGAWSWARCGGDGNCDNRPASVRFHDVNGALVNGVTSLNSKMFHFNIHKCNNIRIENVKIIAPAESPNTDGIHVSQSNKLKIVDSIIGTGDDCVSIGDGTRNVNITGVDCGPGHGISIGSLGKYTDEEDVTGITVANCNLKNTDNGLRIKTWAPSKSSIVVSDVTYSNVVLENVKNPIIIDQFYCPNGECQNNGQSTVLIKGVRYNKITGSSATKTGIDIQCSKTTPCQDVEFNGIRLTMNQKPTIASCSNVQSRFVGSNPARCSSIGN